ncbi:F-box/FBD/LRR-repeat protein At4g26340-like [Argentina anserina]|uniref:F-box/FBD/LRR-repeat protein At4g26340-like n=1 Tax=Argentina anserina TaxID=57926 RepID=UPI00217671C8|nr:F-box/FBD/LRR-repeat protein At4g26340-like [Potentilla anserina]
MKNWGCRTSQFLPNKKHEKSSKPKKKGNLGKKQQKGKGECSSRDQISFVDRISELPDGILVSILSCLLVKEAAATSVLSRRWRDLWASTMTLNFEDEKNSREFMEVKPNIQHRQRRNFVSLVDRAVQRHTGPLIERFRACYFLDSGFAGSIDEWVKFAKEKRVQILELEFSAANVKDNYTFPHELLGLEKGFTGKNLCSGIPSLHSGCSLGFKSLKVLNLRHVNVAGEVLEYLLMNCPVERLSVVAAKNLVDLRVFSPSIKWKYLAIKHCPDLKTIEICDAGIVSFTYIGVGIDLILNNVPLLAEVSITELEIESNDYFNSITISVELPFTQLSCYISQLRYLTMDISEAVYNQDYVFPILANLKYLALICEPHYASSLRYLTSFMKASPQLQRLLVKMNIITSWLEKIGIGILEMEEIVTTEQMESLAKCPHHELRVIEVVGYRARRFAAKHVMLLLKNAVALEKLVIDPVRHWSRGLSMVKEDEDEEMRARTHALKHLKKFVPTTVNFVCLS